MTRALVKLSKGALCLGAIVACLASSPAQAQIEIRISPPAWFIATTSPVYFEGHPSYWYGNRWHYRQGRTWHTYREEPRFLREHRERRPGHRHSYKHDKHDKHDR
jgi:hypothetical protein